MDVGLNAQGFPENNPIFAMCRYHYDVFFDCNIFTQTFCFRNLDY